MKWRRGRTRKNKSSINWSFLRISKPGFTSMRLSKFSLNKVKIHLSKTLSSNRWLKITEISNHLRQWCSCTMFNSKAESTLTSKGLHGQFCTKSFVWTKTNLSFLIHGLSILKIMQRSTTSSKAHSRWWVKTLSNFRTKIESLLQTSNLTRSFSGSWGREQRLLRNLRLQVS